MPIYVKNDYESPITITVKGIGYEPDYYIEFPVEKDDIYFKDCICVFSILDRDNGIGRKYVGVKEFKILDNKNIKDTVNGYLPESVYCFTETSFPLQVFIKEQGFKFFGWG